MTTAVILKSVCVGPGEGVPVFLLLSYFVSSCPQPPTPPHIFCQLAGSFALLVGSDLRTGYSEDIMEEKNFSFHAILWQEPCLLRGEVTSITLKKFGGSGLSPPHSGVCAEVCWSPLLM